MTTSHLILSDQTHLIDQLTNQTPETKKALFLAKKLKSFHIETKRLFPHTFFSDFTEEQCLSAGQCSVRGAA